MMVEAPSVALKTSNHGKKVKCFNCGRLGHKREFANRDVLDYKSIVSLPLIVSGFAESS